MKQEAIFKKFIRSQSLGFVCDQRGQAVVEYILVLIVVVSLVLGLRGVFSSMNAFMSDFMGEYIVCLMEYGELPTLGVQNSDLKNHEAGTGRKCEFRKFSGDVAFSGGGGGSGSGPGSGPSTGGSGSGSGKGSGKNGSDNGNSNNSSGSSGKNGSQGSKSDDGSDSSRGGSSASSRAGRSGRPSPYATGQISKSGSYATADAPQNLNDGKVKTLDEASAGKDNSAQNDSERSKRRRGANDNGKYKAITGGQAEEIEKNSKLKLRKPSSKVLGMSEEGYRFVPHKRTFNPPKSEAVVAESKDESFTFGNFLKWLIIAGIIIACFILFGGQIMNYSNSDS